MSGYGPLSILIKICKFNNYNVLCFIALATIFEVNHSILCDRCAHFIPLGTTTTIIDSHEQFNLAHTARLRFST